MAKMFQFLKSWQKFLYTNHDEQTKKKTGPTTYRFVMPDGTLSDERTQDNPDKIVFPVAGLTFLQAIVAAGQGKQIRRQVFIDGERLKLTDGTLQWVNPQGIEMVVKLFGPDHYDMQKCDLVANDWETVE